MLTVDYILNEGVYKRLGLSNLYKVSLKENCVPEETFIMYFIIASELYNKIKNCNGQWSAQIAFNAAWFNFAKNVSFTVRND